MTAAAVICGVVVCLAYSAVDLPALCARAARHLNHRRGGTS